MLILLALVVCKIRLTKGRCNRCGELLCGCTVHQNSSQEQNNEPWLQVGLRATELLNVQLTCFPMSNCTARFTFVFIQDFAEFVLPERQHVW